MRTLEYREWLIAEIEDKIGDFNDWDTWETADLEAVLLPPDEKIV